MRTSLLRFIGNGDGRSVIDDFVDELRRARDEGFTMMWGIRAAAGDGQVDELTAYVLAADPEAAARTRTLLLAPR